MKFTKRIAAVILAAILLIAVVPTAFAQGEELTFQCEKGSFEYTIYKVASLASTDTGAYNFEQGVADNVKTTINTANTSGADLLAALDTAYADSASSVGTQLNGVVKKSNTKTVTEPGIYYARVSKEDPNATAASNSVIVWPQYKNNAWDYGTNGKLTVDLGDKVDAGNPEVHKQFTGKAATVTTDYSGMNDADGVSFTLTASTVGSAQKKATRYVIWDKMFKGLTFDKDSVEIYYDSVSAANKAAKGDFTVVPTTFKADTEPTTYDANNDADYIDGTYITVTASANLLTSDAFYNHNKVIVVYRADLNKDARIGTAKGNPNKDGLLYNTNGSLFGEEVKVYTCVARINKVNGKTNAALKGATLAIYSGDTELASGTSDDNGLVKFMVNGSTTDEYVLAPGSYKIKEKAAPAGYVLSKDTVNITINDNDITANGVFNVATDFKNYATSTPHTGGEGTMIFTIVGASLVLIAGILAVIVLKKRTKKGEQ